MSRVRQLIAVTLCLVLLSSTSNAWFGFGHMAVAYVAYQKLTDAKKVRVAALLKKNPYYKTKWKALIPAGTPADQHDLMVFMIAATWPDEIKSDPAYNLPDGPAGGNRPPSGPVASQNKGYSDHHRHKYWHFLDSPFTQDGTTLPAIPNPNAESEVDKLRKTLALAKSSKTDALKSYDLVWLMHIVGDVHQPLHSSTRVSSADPQGDNGGNNVKLADPSKELHAFWDGLPGDSSNPADVIPYASALPAADPALVSIKNASTWTKESFDLAQSAVYVLPIGPGDGPFTLDTPYKDKAKKIADERVALAGERLANLINDELK
jgi:hypothetical protein